MLRYYGDNCISLVKKLEPYLIEKKDQADALLKLRELKNKLNQAKKQNHK